VLKSVCFFRSDPFLEFYRQSENGSYNLVHRTEVIKRNLNPEWKPFVVPVRSLCGGDKDRPIRVLCYDWNRSGRHKLIGEFFVTLNKLSKGPGPHNVYPCIKRKKQKVRKNTYYRYNYKQ
jgi:Ca2+-dependent lipid-binding protein